MHNKNKLSNLIKEIEDTKVMLNNLISEKQFNLLDPEVIKLSQDLDKLLSQYDNLNNNI